MVHKWTIQIPELTGDENRNLYIYVPESYEFNRDLRFPVLYMFDGHNVFFDSDATYGRAWRLHDYLISTDTPLIVAAVECNHSPDHGRLSEYSPYPFVAPGIGRISGRGRTTMEWMVNVLKPEIDNCFRTLPDRGHTMIAGSSMGGLMSLYAVLQYNHIFSRAAALSPSLWTNSREIENLIHRARLSKNTIVYMDYGSQEADYRTGSDRLFRRASNLLAERQVAVTSRIVPGGTHCEESWEKQLPFMIPTLMYDL